MAQAKPERRPYCRANTKAGHPCRNHAIVGSTVCRNHGGSTPQVKRAAKLRLLELVDPATAMLARIMTTAAKDSDRLRAIENILDRAGVPRATTVEIDDARQVLIERLVELGDDK